MPVFKLKLNGLIQGDPIPFYVTVLSDEPIAVLKKSHLPKGERGERERQRTLPLGGEHIPEVIVNVIAYGFRAAQTNNYGTSWYSCRTSSVARH